MTRLELRSATPHDATAVASLLAELGYPVAVQEVPDRLEATVAEGGVVLLAVNDDGVPVGLMCLARHRVLHAVGPVAYITALVVSATARGGGVGRALVAAALDWARTNDCVRLSVTSAEHRADAHAFYPRCGMPYTGRRFSAGVTK